MTWPGVDDRESPGSRGFSSLRGEMSLDVKIIPKTQRAKNRVREHGDVFELVKSTGDEVLLQSKGKTWRSSPNSKPEHWLGWFDIDSEIEIDDSFS